jgi:parallel beta-helix repeat protein
MMQAMLPPMAGLGALIVALLLTSGCGAQTSAPQDPAAFEKALRTQLETATPGKVITIPAGTHPMTRSLTLNTSGVTIRGEGMDKSVLSFKGQLAGAEGILVNASDFTIEDLAIEDAKGDALKINEGKNIAIRRVRTEWTGGPNTANGAYGIYPVQTDNTLIEGSAAIGASDAGIYVGQSRNVVVRNNRAEYNVAGIEIENTIGADVHDNLATHNTGGILVFNMPDLPQPGHATRVFRNQVVDNNTPNFGAPGSAVASVPAGSGVVVNSNDQVEIFDNQIGSNDTANVLISSYFSVQYSGERNVAENFDPYPEGIYIHGNTFTAGGTAPQRDTLVALKRALFADSHLPDVVWDGIVDQDKLVDGALPAELSLCIDNDGSDLLNADAANGSANPKIDTDAHRCRLDALPAIVLRQPLATS